MAFETDLTGFNRDAFTALNDLFSSYGIGTLAPKITEFLKNGYSPDTISILLQQSPEYQQRFSANTARQKAGLPVLSPAEYLSTEKSYRQIMEAAGLPPGFYDQPQDFQKFLEEDKSPQEIQQRVQDATDFVNKSDPQTLQQFKQWYSTGDMIAYALDPDRAVPLIEKAFNASRIAGQGNRQGIGVDQSTAELLANRGITQDQASQGFGLIAGEKPTTDKLSSIYGDGLTTNDLVKETFLNDAAATQKRSVLASKERATFGGVTGTGQDTLSKAGGGNF